MGKMPHLYGVSSTLVSRLLHTCVLLAPHLCPVSSTLVWNTVLIYRLLYAALR